MRHLSLLLLLLPLVLRGQQVTSSQLANTFLRSLPEALQKKACFPVGEMNRYEFHYVPASMLPRSGISLVDLDSTQRGLFLALLQHQLSAEGYKKTRDIMSYEYLLQILQPNNAHRIPENYFVAFYGTPRPDSLWGWKMSGHHIALNFTLIRDEVSFAPFFFGIYPAEVESGPHKGERLLKAEEDAGFELLHALNARQQQKAIIQIRAYTDIVSTNSQEVAPLQAAGIFARDMNHAQKALLDKLIALYLSAMPEAQANARRKQIMTEKMDDICFAWAGAQDRSAGHYYRIQGKSFLIEFDNTQNNANHIHTVWRDFNGDFGRDLIREHYQESRH